MSEQMLFYVSVIVPARTRPQAIAKLLTSEIQVSYPSVSVQYIKTESFPGPEVAVPSRKSHYHSHESKQAITIHAGHEGHGDIAIQWMDHNNVEHLTVISYYVCGKPTELIIEICGKGVAKRIHEDDLTE